MRKRAAFLVVVTLIAAAMGSCTISVEPHCRGDTFPADKETNLVHCWAIDSVARHG